VDTDEIYRNLTAPAQKGIAEIARRFGPEFVAKDGSLDRARMRGLAFADPSARKELEAILHPLIRQDSARQIRASTARYIILVVPLLIETGAYQDALRRILVVDCELETQIDRVMKRSGLARDEVLSIIATQASRQERMQCADDVINNDNGFEPLQIQVAALHTRYLGFAENG
jgi:dephospho-CoA kinase